MHRQAHHRSGLDRINQAAYRRAGVLRQYETASGWLEPGEQAAVMLAAKDVRGAPVLDIGIGGGRTVPLMRAISDDFCGIDYSPAMVAVARRRFPDVDIRTMDARDLAFPNRRFALATFSYNGIDSVDMPGRLLILAEVRRVLRRRGRFVFSALHRGSMVNLPHWPDWEVFHDAGLQPGRLFRATARLLAGGINHLRGLALVRDDGDVAVASLSAHNFALLAIFMSLTTQIRELHEAGFAVEAIFAPDGQRIPPDDPADDGAPWHHFVARKVEARRGYC